MIIRSTDQIKQANVASVREALWGREWSTVAYIVRKTQLSAPTVGRIIDEMLNSGEVLASEIELVTGGRRAKQYVLNASFSYALCIYIEKEIIWYDLSDVAEKSVERGELVVENFNHRELIVELIGELLFQYPALKAVSIGVPAWVHNDELCSIVAYPGFEKLNFRELIADKFDLPCHVNNDLNALVTGYYDMHCRESAKSLCGFYHSSSGPGSGVIIEGKLCSGKSGFAGEIANLPIGDKSLKDILMSSDSEQAKISAIADMVCTLVMVCDLDIMLFCTYGNRLPSIDAVKQECAKRLPAQAMPEFVESADYHTYYVYGLRTIANSVIAENR